MSTNLAQRSVIRQWLRSTTALVGCLPMLGLTISLAHANPQGGAVTQGSATISQPDPKTVQINQSSDRAIIDWKSFSIAAGETTRFIQPSSSSMTLNRVTGDQVSQILGNLQANGRVVLVNPNGIVFGAGSKIDVAALIASTANIKNENFMAGNLRFDIPGKANAQIINEGTITAADGGLVAIVSPYLRNSGIISARLGKVALAAANGVTLDLYGDNLILFQASDKIASQIVGADGQPVASLIENSGKIYADGGRVLMSASAAKGVVDNAINTTGLVSARTVERQGGEIILKGGDNTTQVTGRLDVSGLDAAQVGGRAEITGNQLKIGDSAVVDASGGAGGGRILVGGDYLGGEADPWIMSQFGIEREQTAIPNAMTTTVAQGALLKADATADGKGGKVVVWADGHTSFTGAISARGAGSGLGGFAEVSGKRTLAYTGRADLGSLSGRFGTLLLDPANIDIFGTAGGGGASTNIDVNDGTSGVSEALLEAASSNILLYAGTRISVQSNHTFGGGEITLPQNISITMKTRNSSGSGDADGLISLYDPGTAAPGDETYVGLRTQGTGSINIYAGRDAGSDFGNKISTVNLHNLTTELGNINIYNDEFMNFYGTSIRTYGGAIVINSSNKIIPRENMSIRTASASGSTNGDVTITSPSVSNSFSKTITVYRTGNATVSVPNSPSFSINGSGTTTATTNTSAGSLQAAIDKSNRISQDRSEKDRSEGIWAYVVSQGIQDQFMQYASSDKGGYKQSIEKLEVYKNYKNADFVKLSDAVDNGVITADKKDPLWRSLYVGGKPTEAQNKVLFEKYSNENFVGIFNLLRSGSLSQTDQVWNQIPYNARVVAAKLLSTLEASQSGNAISANDAMFLAIAREIEMGATSLSKLKKVYDSYRAAPEPPPGPDQSVGEIAEKTTASVEFSGESKMTFALSGSSLVEYKLQTLAQEKAEGILSNVKSELESKFGGAFYGNPIANYYSSQVDLVQKVFSSQVKKINEPAMINAMQLIDAASGHSEDYGFGAEPRYNLLKDVKFVTSKETGFNVNTAYGAKEAFTSVLSIIDSGKNAVSTASEVKEILKTTSDIAKTFKEGYDAIFSDSGAIQNAINSDNALNAARYWSNVKTPGDLGAVYTMSTAGLVEHYTDTAKQEKILALTNLYTSLKSGEKVVAGGDKLVKAFEKLAETVTGMAAAADMRKRDIVNLDMKVSGAEKVAEQLFYQQAYLQNKAEKGESISSDMLVMVPVKKIREVGYWPFNRNQEYYDIGAYKQIRDVPEYSSYLR
ncbi:filamentous hemagglutinin N-terminal domain-containing protein [Paramagnetospirillum magneticum]|uniref:Large exoprotein involved in heme utilization or adhesion n=1 Tax=Paramagnetospirillum magneticum (strain ATCC 700264 / AMB-1) TaxID=342108 RepID=Q2W0P8_PARM1|nr:filamentous hemagglutinin N-terminal domain-containing protein [Paramagnetospirillum magneticum]BAE52577.1 Large exoprotein involved in heme utilization or adhesion [Paramagnetospirillum magneticum AMB-1]